MTPQLPPPIRPTPLTREDREDMQRRGCTPRQIAYAELRGEGHAHAEATMILFRRAHGHLCCAMAHLHHAASLFAEEKPEVTAILRNHARKLDEILPSFPEFDAATRKPSSPR